MKKTFITYCILCMTLALFAASCYDDKSTSGKISDTVEIDTTGFGAKIEIANGNTLRLSPKVTPADDPISPSNGKSPSHRTETRRLFPN